MQAHDDDRDKSRTLALIAQFSYLFVTFEFLLIYYWQSINVVFIGFSHLVSVCLFLCLDLQLPEITKNIDSKKIAVLFCYCFFSFLGQVFTYVGLCDVGPFRVLALKICFDFCLLAIFGVVYRNGQNRAIRANKNLIIVVIILFVCICYFDKTVIMENIEKNSENENEVENDKANIELGQLEYSDIKYGLIWSSLGISLSILAKNYGSKVIQVFHANHNEANNENVLKFFTSLFSTVGWFLLSFYFELSSQDVEPGAIGKLFFVIFISFLFFSGPVINLSITNVNNNFDKINVFKNGILILMVLFFLLPSSIMILKSKIVYSSLLSVVFLLISNAQEDTVNPLSKKGMFYDNKQGYSKGFGINSFRIYLAQILSSNESRQIFYFLCLNLAFTMVEFIWGIWSNSLGLISDAVHMLFDCIALAVGLIASIMARWPPNSTYSFGYGRVETLSAYVNGIFLVGTSFSILSESINRVLDPPEIGTEKLTIVSILGLIVNLVGIFAFSHAHSHGHGGGGCSHSNVSTAEEHSHSHSHSHSSHGHSHGEPKPKRNENMEGVFLHIVADTLGSVGVVISSLLIDYYGLLIADPICSIAISIMIFISVIPLLLRSSRVLLQRNPKSDQEKSLETLVQISKIKGVLKIISSNFWEFSNGAMVVTLHVSIDAQQANERDVFKAITGLIQKNISDVKNITLQIKKENEEQQHQEQPLFVDNSLIFNYINNTSNSLPPRSPTLSKAGTPYSHTPVLPAFN